MGDALDKVLALTPRTPEASTVPEPHGKPNGPGLFHVKKLQAPPYIQHVAGELMKKGKSESEAYHMAVGIVKNWASGHDGHGHKVHADVHAAAVKNIAQWEKDKAIAHAQHAGKDAKDKVAATAHDPYLEVLLAAPAGWPSGKPYASSMLPPGPTTSVKTVQFDPRRPGRVLNAPGTKPLTGGNAVGGFGYGQLVQAPSQTVAAGPNLPSTVKPPTADEINAVAVQLTPYIEESDVLRGAQKFLNNAAKDATDENYVEALRMIRSAAASVTAERRRRVLAAAPIVMSYQGVRTGGLAGPNTGVPPAAQSSNANAAVSQAYKGINDMKALVATLAQFIDRIRRYHFHGMYGGLGGPSVRFSGEFPVADMLLLANVRAYERVEHGRIERVGPEERIEQARAYWTGSGQRGDVSAGMPGAGTVGARTTVTPDMWTSVGGEKDAPRWAEPGQVVTGAGLVGEVNKSGATWQATHADSTVLGRHPTRAGAIKELLYYHNQMANRKKPDQGEIENLERANEEANPLHQQDREAFNKKMWDAGVVPKGVDPDEHYSTLAEMQADGDRSAADEIERMHAAGYRSRMQRNSSKVDSGDPTTWLTSPLDKVLALADVRGYVREEHGKLEHVEPYSTSHLDKVVAHVSDAAADTGGLGGAAYPGEHEHQGYFTDALGEKHWGWWGAAGLLVHHDDENGVRRYLLQKRSGGVQHGGTWSTPGGAIDEGETPVEAAFREAEEEFGKMPENLQVVQTHTRDFGTPGQVGHWAYHTVSASSPEMFKPAGNAKMGFESAGFQWVTPEEMAKLNLHPAFKATAQRLGAPVSPDPEKPAPAPYDNRGFQPGDKVMARLGEFPVPGSIAGEKDTNGRYLVNVKGGQLQRFGADLNHVYAPGETVWTRDNKNKIVKATVLPSSKGNNYDLRLEGEAEDAKAHYRRGSEIRKLHEMTEEKAKELNSKPPPPKYNPPSGGSYSSGYKPGQYSSKATWGEKKGFGKFNVGDRVTAKMPWSDTVKTGTVTEKGKFSGTIKVKLDAGQDWGGYGKPPSELTYMPEDLRLESEGTEAKKPAAKTAKMAKASAVHKVGDRVSWKEAPEAPVKFGAVTQATEAMVAVKGDDGVEYAGKHADFRPAPAPKFKMNQPVSYKATNAAMPGKFGTEQFGSVVGARYVDNGGSRMILYKVKHQSGAVFTIGEGGLTSVAPPPVGLTAGRAIIRA